jgi:hypothetical protein
VFGKKKRCLLEKAKMQICRAQARWGRFRQMSVPKQIGRIGVPILHNDFFRFFEHIKGQLNIVIFHSNS